LKWAATLPSDQRAAMQLPILTYDEFVPLRLDTVAQINNRTDHQLEGFESVTKWRPTGMECDWRALAALEQLPVGSRAFVEHKNFLETPAERRAKLRGRGRWSACPPSFLAMVYAFRAMPLTVNKGTIHLKRGTSHWWYMADSRTKMAQLGIEDGKEYLVSYNPFAMDYVHLLSVDGKAYIDTWQSRGHRRGDKDANARSMAHRLGLQREVEQKVERLLIASGETIDTELRRDFNRQLGAPAEATRTQIISSAPADSSANDGAALQHSKEDAGAEFSPADDASGEPTIATAAVVRPAEFPAAHETKRGIFAEEVSDQRSAVSGQNHFNQRSHPSALAASPDAGGAGSSPAPRHNLRLAVDLTRVVATVDRGRQTARQQQADRDQFRNRIMAKRQAELAEADTF